MSVRIERKAKQWRNGGWYIATTVHHSLGTHGVVDCTTFRSKEQAEKAIAIREKDDRAILEARRETDQP